jgi:hypothetical protein
MPQIPTLNAARVNPNAPGAALENVDAAGIVDRAIAGAAQKGVDYGVSLLEKRKKAADNDYAFKTYVDDYQAVEEHSQKLKLEMPEDATGYAEKMKEFVDKRRTDNEANAPSEEGLRMYREKATSLFKGAEIESQNFENTTRAKYYVKSLNENANNLASTFLKNPDYNKAKDVQHTLETEIENNAQTHFVDAGTREKLKQEVRDHVSVSVYDGLDAQERYGEQIRLLKNTDPNSDIFSGMDAEKRGSLLRRAESGLQTQRRQGDMELRGRISDVVAAQDAGEEIPADVLGQLHQKVAMSTLAPYEKEKFADALQVSSLVATETKRLQQTPMNQWGTAKDSIPDRPDAQNGRVVLKAQAALENKMNKMRKEAAEDPASYALKSSPALQKQSGMITPGDPQQTQDFANNLMARQDALGVPRQILTKNQAQQLAQNFTNVAATNPQDAARQALALRMSHGKNAPKLFAEIAQAGKLPSDFMLVSMTPSIQSSTAIMDNIANGATIKKTFKDSTNINQDTFARRVSNKLDPYSSAMKNQGGTGSLSLVNAVSNQVQMEAMKSINMGTFKPDQQDEAIDHAVDTVVKNNFTVVKEGKTNFMMPKYDGNMRPYDEKSTAAFVRAHSTADGFKALNVAVPAAIQKTFADKAAEAPVANNDLMLPGQLAKDMAPSESGQQRFYQTLEKNGYWTPSADNSELVLAMKSPVAFTTREGKFITVGQAIAIKDTSGKPIKRSLHDITYDQDERTLAEATPWYQKVWKSNSANAKGK